MKAIDVRELHLTLSTNETEAFKAILNSVNDSGLNEDEKKVFDEMYTEVSNFLSRR